MELTKNLREKLVENLWKIKKIKKKIKPLGKFYEKPMTNIEKILFKETKRINDNWKKTNEKLMKIKTK